MKKRVLIRFCQILCILLFFLLLSHSGLVLFYAKKGLFSWAFSVLPVLLPFIILSKFWIYWDIPRAIYRTSARLFPNRSTFAVSFTVLCLGLSTGFPVGAIFLRHFYEQKLLSKKDAELLLPLCSFVSPMFLAGIVRPLLGLPPRRWAIFISSLYFPVVAFFVLCFFCRPACDERPDLCGRPYRTADRKKTAGSEPIRDIWLSSLEIIFTIGIYMMLFSILSGVALHQPALNHKAIELLLCNLEISTGIERLSNMQGLPRQLHLMAAAFTTAFGGICTAAQIHGVIGHNSLSMKPYFIIKTACSILSSIFCLIILR